MSITFCQFWIKRDFPNQKRKISWFYHPKITSVQQKRRFLDFQRKWSLRPSMLHKRTKASKRVRILELRKVWLLMGIWYWRISPILTPFQEMLKSARAPLLTAVKMKMSSHSRWRFLENLRILPILKNTGQIWWKERGKWAHQAKTWCTWWTPIVKTQISKASWPNSFKNLKRRVKT